MECVDVAAGGRGLPSEGAARDFRVFETCSGETRERCESVSETDAAVGRFNLDDESTEKTKRGLGII